ncbi:hypothetical protein HKD37_17G048136 [Glycine soja]
MAIAGHARVKDTRVKEKIEIASGLTIRFKSHLLCTASLFPSSFHHHPLISSPSHFSLHRLLSTTSRTLLHSNKSVDTGARVLALDKAPLDLRAQLRRPHRLCCHCSQQIPRPGHVLRHPNRSPKKLRKQSNKSTVPIRRSCPGRQHGVSGVVTRSGVCYHQSHL